MLGLILAPSIIAAAGAATMSVDLPKPAPGAAVAAAAAAPAPARPVDPRIRVVPFEADQIVRLVAHTGFQVMIELEPGDRIETIAIGDATNWQITPNAAGNVVFVKPVGIGPITNLSMVTSRRRYNLELVAQSGAKARRGDIIFALRFVDPAAPAPTPPQAQPAVTEVPAGPVNRRYSFEGSDVNVPSEVFDDGRSTFFRFAPGAAQPAIFADLPGAGESVVNVQKRGDYVVVDQVAASFVLRDGAETTRLFNDGYTPPQRGADAPLRRPARKRGLLGLGGKAS